MNTATQPASTSSNRAMRRAADKAQRRKAAPRDKTLNHPVAKAIQARASGLTSTSTAPSVQAPTHSRAESLRRASRDLDFAQSQAFFPVAKVLLELVALLLLAALYGSWLWLLSVNPGTVPDILRGPLAVSSAYQVQAHQGVMALGFLLAAVASRHTAAFALITFASSWGFAMAGYGGDFLQLVLASAVFGLVFSFNYFRRYERHQRSSSH